MSLEELAAAAAQNTTQKDGRFNTDYNKVGDAYQGSADPGLPRRLPHNRRLPQNKLVTVIAVIGFVFVVFVTTMYFFMGANRTKSLATRGDSLALMIQEHRTVAERQKQKTGIYDLALSNLPFITALDAGYRDFFADGGACKVQPNEHIIANFLQIKRSELSNFLASAFVKELPKNAASKLDVVRYTQQETTFVESFSKMFDDAEGNENFEIGHLMVKIVFDPSTVHIMVLAPVLTGRGSNGCFSKRFREEFVGKSQGIQAMLAIKAAASKQFIDAMDSFSLQWSPNDVPAVAFQKIDVIGGTGYKTEMSISDECSGIHCWLQEYVFTGPVLITTTCSAIVLVVLWRKLCLNHPSDKEN
jgi:hypothetical protein